MCKIFDRLIPQILDKKDHFWTDINGYAMCNVSQDDPNLAFFKHGNTGWSTNVFERMTEKAKKIVREAHVATLNENQSEW